MSNIYNLNGPMGPIVLTKMACISINGPGHEIAKAILYCTKVTSQTLHVT